MWLNIDRCRLSIIHSLDINAKFYHRLMISFSWTWKVFHLWPNVTENHDWCSSMQPLTFLFNSWCNAYFVDSKKTKEENLALSGLLVNLDPRPKMCCNKFRWCILCRTINQVAILITAKRYTWLSLRNIYCKPCKHSRNKHRN